MAGRIDRQTLKRVQGSESDLGALFLFVVNWNLRVPGQDSATSIVLFPDFWIFVSPRVCVLPCEFQRDGKSRHPQTTHSLKHAKGHKMKAFFLALTLINASPEEQDLMLADMYDADPRLAYEVLDVADGLGADTDELAIVIAIIADSTGDESRHRTYKGFSAGEVLFLGASGSLRMHDQWELTYKFAASTRWSSHTYDSTKAISDPGRMFDPVDEGTFAVVIDVDGKGLNF